MKHNSSSESHKKHYQHKSHSNSNSNSNHSTLINVVKSMEERLYLVELELIHLKRRMYTNRVYGGNDMDDNNDVNVTRRYSKSNLLSFKPATLPVDAAKTHHTDTYVLVNNANNADVDSESKDLDNQKDSNACVNDKTQNEDKEKENDGKKPQVTTTLNVQGGLRLKLLRNRD